MGSLVPDADGIAKGDTAGAHTKPSREALGVAGAHGVARGVAEARLRNASSQDSNLNSWQADAYTHKPKAPPPATTSLT